MTSSIQNMTSSVAENQSSVEHENPSASAVFVPSASIEISQKVPSPAVPLATSEADVPDLSSPQDSIMAGDVDCDGSAFQSLDVDSKERKDLVSPSIALIPESEG